ncbi:cytochrome c family protein [Caballeronia sordidicola]|uniref:Cytochrome c family protein n=1 Tax=Caballeronia sordidicola TaxID=196367 RepID=A0A158F9F1_CABSO|nr:c-type cytochrome [Caballeronia sordidicola]SAL16486.1 cytochrome c family protein [Caballeronia sordidicola]
MKRWFLGSVAAAVVLIAAAHGAVAADMPTSAVSPADAMNIARKNACMGCHAVDRKLVGPSFQQIAEKYKGDAKALARLETKVRDGGSGVWGMLPMPSHRSMDSGDITKVVGWILAGSPSK